MQEKLFSEFPPVSTEQWEEAINKDLKGADYNKKLVWRTNEGFNVRPYYRQEDLKDIPFLGSMPGEYPYVRGTKINNDWEVLQVVNEANPAAANALALDSLKKGATTIVFNAREIKTAAELQTLLAGIDMTKTGVQFAHATNYIELAKLFIAETQRQKLNPAEVKAAFEFDCISYALQHGSFWKSEQDDMQQAVELVRMFQAFELVRPITIKGINLHNCGATISQELAYSLASAEAYLTFCTEQGCNIDDVACSIQLALSIGSVYFMEISKLRAARMLWANLIRHYNPACDCSEKLHVQSIGSTWNKTLYDPYINMLRSTTEGMSAAIGGTDAMSLTPFDVAYKDDDEFSRHISRNVQSLLKEEAYFNRIVDPAAGSYYIENLTNSIAEQAWNRFLSIEEEGGIVAMNAAGKVKADIEETCRQRNMEIATRRTILLGTNQYPNTNEQMADKIEKDPAPKANAAGLQPYRGAMPFEQLRLETEKWSKQNGSRPKVFLLKMGNVAMRQARAGFVTNFYGCAGFEILDNQGFKTVEEGVKAALDSKAQIVALCSSDEEYATLGVEATAQLKATSKNLWIVVAGNPTECVEQLKAAGANDFVHVRVNVLDTLKNTAKEILK